MVDSLWFVLTLVLLAVVSVALVLVLILRREETRPARETRTEYLHPDYGQACGFRVASAPSSEVILPYRYWLIEERVSEIDYDIVPGRRMSLRTAKQGQNAGRISSIFWVRDGYEYLLYSMQPEMNMIAGLAVPFVTNTRVEPAV